MLGMSIFTAIANLPGSAYTEKKEEIPMEKKKDLLLIVDMQNVYTAGQDWACWRIQKAADSILRLLSSGALKT